MSLSITKERIPNEVANKLYQFNPVVDPNKIYVLPTPGGTTSGYMIFKGDSLR